MNNPTISSLSRLVSAAKPARARSSVRAAPPAKSKRFLRWSIKEQTLFMKRLSVLIKADVPILTSITMLHGQATSRTSKHVLGHLREKVEQGALLSSGMQAFETIFGNFCVSVVRVGEMSGTLDENLGYLADELKKKQELRRRVLSALVYPAFVFVATVGIALLLTMFVFPKIMPIFQSFRFELPWTTRLLIAISEGLRAYWLALLLTVVALVGGSVLAMRYMQVKHFVHRNILRLPLIGRLLLSYQVANFTRTLSLLLKSDIRIVEGLSMVGATSGNVAYREAFEAIGQIVNKGEKISTAMERDPLLFPSIVTQMVAVGESTGKLSDSLSYLSVMYEDELKNLTTNLATAIEPILMIFMGLLVGFIAISIITPIYAITQNLHP